MDLLEYQGKELFARHGLRVSSGRAVQSVEDAVSAAPEIGYPVVVKAQVVRHQGGAFAGAAVGPRRLPRARRRYPGERLLAP